MPIDSLIITFYCEIEKIYDEAIKNGKLRKRGRPPSLSDVEVLTMLVAGEYLGLGSDKKIWSYFCSHWKAWFPRMPYKFYTSMFEFSGGV